MFEKIIIGIIWAGTVLPFLAATGYVLSIFTLNFTAVAAQTTPFAVIVLPLVALIVFVKLVRSFVHEMAAE